MALVFAQMFVADVLRHYVTTDRAYRTVLDRICALCGPLKGEKKTPKGKKMPASNALAVISANHPAETPQGTHFALPETFGVEAERLGFPSSGL